MNQNQRDESQEALAVLRGIWHARGQSAAFLDEALGATGGSTKSCKRMRDIGFGGLAGDTEAPDGDETSPVGNDLRAAWRSTLEREGKRNPDSRGLWDVVSPQAESEQ